MSSPVEEILFRKPSIRDGRAVHQLISQSPPLDLNSVYSYYLLSDHFQDSCVIAEKNGQVVGFLSAYPVPQRPDTLFVWQVVVSAELRGQHLAARMLDSVLERLGEAVHFVEATVNPSNMASRKLFESLARKHQTQVQESVYLQAEDFGPAAAHESEILFRIPLNA